MEFTVGREYSEMNDGEIVVGFNRGNLAKGIICVDRGDTIRVNSKESVIVAMQFEAIVKKSGLAPFDKQKNTGLWRILLYRESRETN